MFHVLLEVGAERKVFELGTSTLRLQSFASSGEINHKELEKIRHLHYAIHLLNQLVKLRLAVLCDRCSCLAVRYGPSKLWHLHFACKLGGVQLQPQKRFVHGCNRSAGHCVLQRRKDIRIKVRIHIILLLHHNSRNFDCSRLKLLLCDRGTQKFCNKVSGPSSVTCLEMAPIFEWLCS